MENPLSTANLDRPLVIYIKKSIYVYIYFIYIYIYIFIVMIMPNQVMICSDDNG